MQVEKVFFYYNLLISVYNFSFVVNILINNANNNVWLSLLANLDKFTTKTLKPKFQFPKF